MAYIVRSFEREMGDEYWSVTAPDRTPLTKVFETLSMARKYAYYMDTYLTEAEGKERYDEHYEEMAEIFEESNGQETFNAYLRLKGYKVEPLIEHFSYEW